MKILVIANQLSIPPRTGGSIIIYNHLLQLSTRNELDLIALGDPELNRSPVLSKLCRRITVHPNLIPGGMSTLLKTPLIWLKSPGSLLSLAILGIKWIFGIPLAVSPYASAAIQASVKERLQDGHYDAVLFYGLPSAQYLPDSVSIVKILNIEDPLGVYIERVMFLQKSRLVRLILKREQQLLIRYEGKQSLRFNCVTLLNNEDLKDFQKYSLSKDNLDWVPYGVDTAHFSPEFQIPRIPGRIVITGNLHHPPNVQAVEYFCAEILPLIQSKFPSVSLYLVGANPSAQIRKWETINSAIKVIGSVPDIRPYLREALVSICLVRVKIGTQTKILEALACGTPVVTTPEGNNGIQGIQGKHLEIADNPQEFATKVIKLLELEGWEEMSVNGRHFVVEHFDWAACIAKLKSIITSAKLGAV